MPFFLIGLKTQSGNTNMTFERLLILGGFYYGNIQF